MEKKDIEKLLKEGNTVQFHPVGGSMFPMFSSPDDYAVVEPLSGPVRRSDVVVYRKPNGPLVMHRVVKAGKDGVWLLGDRQTKVEGPVDLSLVIGKLTHYIKKGKKRSVKNIGYRSLSALWLVLRPVRQVLFDAGHYILVLLKKR